jgi:membrane associated rhomboid family serine protease
VTEPGDTEIRRAPDRRRAEEWALVLEAAGIEARVERAADGWPVFAAAEDAARAREALAAYDGDATRGEEDAERPGGGAGLAVAAVLAGAYVLTGPRGAFGTAFRAGAAVAERIVAGEWWRAVTALTLHADAAHLLGNAATGFVFTTAVCRGLGPGLGVTLVLATGVAGNAAAALVRRTASSSVGASTAIFGAVGLLCGRAAVRAARGRRPGRRAWVPLAAGLALLALLGTSERADLLAHVTGFVVGLPLGAMTAATPPPRPAVQALLAAGSAALVAGAWALALGALEVSP